MSLLTLLQLNLAAAPPVTILPQHQYTATARTRDFAATARTRAFTATARRRDF